ncbi:MAG: nuclear transport factor 2 family protein [Cyclobacteriaceae bacterium]
MKSILTTILLFLGSIAFAQTNQEQQNKSIALGVFEAFNAHDWQKMAGYYHDEAVIEDPSEPEPVIGVADMPTKYAGYAEFVPDIQDKVTNLYVFRNHVVIEFTSHGTTIEGDAFSLPICTIMTIEDGKITRDASYYDLKN